MNYRIILNIMGRIMCVEAAFMLPALCIAVYCKESSSALAFIITMALLVVLGLLFLHQKPARHSFYTREGMVSAGLVWILVSLFGAMPFFISGAIPNFIDCFFEAVSGFTTTGASILSDVEALPTSIKYWRSFTHWLGGMGVLVFLLAMAPTSQNSGDSMHILRAESPGVSVGKLVPKIHNSAKILYTIYIVLTLVQLGFMLAGGIPVFDAVTLTFGTAGTGGFGIKNDSMASYSPYIQTVVTAFMLLFAVNFNLIYYCILRQFKRAFKNEELLVYLGIVFVSILLITLNTLKIFGTFSESLHHAAFQVASIISTTGYSTTDYNLWPEFSKTTLILLTMIGGCAGSTAGGLKVIRVIIATKSANMTIFKKLRPHSMKQMHMDGAPMDYETVNDVKGYIMIYFMIAFASIFLLSIEGHDFVTNFTSVFTCLNNVGPGLNMVGPMGNFSGFSGPSTLLLSINMLLGRLELFPILALFAPSVWKK